MPSTWPSERSFATAQRAGLGTDHAWGGHSFVVGGGLKEGKVLGQEGPSQ